MTTPGFAIFCLKNLFLLNIWMMAASVGSVLTELLHFEINDTKLFQFCRFCGIVHFYLASNQNLQMFSRLNN